MSTFGTKQTYRHDLLFVRFCGKADIGGAEIPQCSGLLPYWAACYLFRSNQWRR